MKNIQQEQQNDTWARLVDSLWIIDSNLLRKFLTFGSVGRMGISLGFDYIYFDKSLFKKITLLTDFSKPRVRILDQVNSLRGPEKKKTFFLGASVIDHRNTCSISMAGLQKLIGNQSIKKKKTMKLHMDILCHLPCNKNNKYFLQV